MVEPLLGIDPYPELWRNIKDFIDFAIKPKKMFVHKFLFIVYYFHRLLSDSI